MILDDLALRERCATNAAEGCFTPTYVSTKELELLVLECERRTEIPGEGRRRCGHQRRLAP